jgi:DNA polymerase-3 subunit beta
MKFTCTKNVLVDAVTVASKTLSNNNIEGLATTSCFKMSVLNDTLTIESTDLSQGTVISTPVMNGEDGSILVEGKFFGELVKKLPDAMVILKSKTETFELDCGTSHFEMKTVPGEFPEVPSTIKAGFKIDGVAFRDLILRSSYAFMKGGALPQFEAVNLRLKDNMLRAVTIDGYRLANGIETIDGGGDDMDILIPVSSLSSMVRSIKKAGPIELIQDDHQFYLQLEDCMHTCRLLEGESMNVDQLLQQPETNAKIKNVQADKLIECLERSLVLRDAKNNLLKLSITNDQLIIESNSDYGSVHEVLAIEAELKDGLFKIGINGMFMLEAVKNFPSETMDIEMSENTAPIFITSEAVPDQAMFLPVRYMED